MPKNNPFNISAVDERTAGANLEVCQVLQGKKVYCTDETINSLKKIYTSFKAAFGKRFVTDFK